MHKKVLVVDDSQTIRTLMQSALEEIGAEVIEAVNGEEALTQVQSEQDIGLIFLDVNMPVMNGMTFLEKIDELYKAGKERIPTFMLTTQSNREIIEKANKVFGVSGWIVKPVKSEFVGQLYKKFCLGENVILGRGHQPATERKIPFEEVKQSLSQLGEADKGLMEKIGLSSKDSSHFNAFSTKLGSDDAVFLLPVDHNPKDAAHLPLSQAIEIISLYVITQRGGKDHWRKVWPTSQLLKEVEESHT